MVCMSVDAHPAKGVLAVRRITQRAAATALGCNPRHLNAVLNGERKGSDSLKRRLADYLGRPVSELFTSDRVAS